MHRESRNSSVTPTQATLLRIAQAARTLECSPRMIWRLLSLGRLQKVQIGRAVRVTRASVDKFIAEGGAK